MPSSCASTWPRDSRGSSTRVTPAIRLSPASSARSGWLRCSSAERKVTTSSTAACRRLRTRKLSRSRVGRSAQCTSSTTSTSGRRSASASSRASTSSNSRARAMIRVSPGRRGAEFRQQRGQLAGVPAAQQRGHPGGAPLPDQLPQRRGERRIRQARRGSAPRTPRPAPAPGPPPARRTRSPAATCRRRPPRRPAPCPAARRPHRRTPWPARPARPRARRRPGLPRGWSYPQDASNPAAIRAAMAPRPDRSHHWCT